MRITPRSAALTVLVAAAAVAIVRYGSHVAPEMALIETAGLTLRELGAPGVLAFVGIYAIAVLGFAPASLFTILAGAVYGYWGVPISLAGALFGALSAFALARRSLRARVVIEGRHRRRLLALDLATTRLGWRAVLLVRLSPLIPFSIQNYLFGMTGVGATGYTLASLVGMLPATFVKIGIGMIVSGTATFSADLTTVALTFGVPASIALPWVYLRAFGREVPDLSEDAPLPPTSP